MELKLFIWSHDNQNHFDNHLVFATNETYAREALRVSLWEDWKLPAEDPAYHTEDYLAYRENWLATTFARIISCAADGPGDGKWNLEVRKIKPGAFTI